MSVQPLAFAFGMLASPGSLQLAAVPFSLSDVSLDASGLFGIAQARNLEFVIGINSSQLLCQYTSAANLTKCEGGNCPSPGGESRPICNPLPGQMSLGGYYGHYLGHWLSATAFLINGTRDASVRAKVASIVTALEATMDAWKAKYGDEHDGYLFPYDPIVFHYLHTLSAGCKSHLCGIYSVPYYTLHKMMAGLLDLHTQTNDATAFQMLLRMASWVMRQADSTIASSGQNLWQSVLNTEWGGMNEVLFNLYAVTGDPEHLRTGRLFNHWSWSAPLANGIDAIGGQHANTHIPEVLGNAVAYELSENATDKAIALQFWEAVTRNHSWVTGGSNDHEYWGAAHRMGDSLDGDTEESCTQYNILKVARHLFMWSANVSLADFYEKAMLNGIVGNQKRDAASTSFIYMLPLGGTGMTKPWGNSQRDFPCCWGTLSEQLAKLADSIYFQSPLGLHDPPALYVNLFVASKLQFAAGGVSVTQSTTFPVDPRTTTTITIGTLDASESALVEGTRALGRFVMYLRVPGWAALGPNVVLVNGQVVHEDPGTFAGNYLRIERAWAEGDTVVARFPVGFGLSRLEDDRDAFNATMAYTYGPLVLVGLTDSRWFVPDGNATTPSTFLTRTSSTALEFEGHGQLYAPAPATARGNASALPLSRMLVGSKLMLVPLHTIVDERYTVYFDTELKTVPFSADGAVIPSMSAADFSYGGGSSSSDGPRDVACSGPNIRSGNPGGVSRVTFDHPMLAPGYLIDKISLHFRYSAGYTPGPGANITASTVRVLLSDANGGALAVIYQSDELGNYSYDHFEGYSPPIVASASSLKVPNEELVFLVLEITNHDRNLQIPIDDLASGFNATVEWMKLVPDHHQHHHHQHDGHVHAAPVWSEASLGAVAVPPITPTGRSTRAHECTDAGHSCATVPSLSASDFLYGGGSGVSGGPRDSMCSGTNLRSGDPGSVDSHPVGRITFAHPMLAPGYLIQKMSLSFRYAAGYTPGAGEQKKASTVRVLLSDARGGSLAVIYQSDELGNYSYDHFKGYSPPIVVVGEILGGAGLPNEEEVYLVLEISNNDRNLLLPIDDLASGFNATVEWMKLGEFSV